MSSANVNFFEFQPVCSRGAHTAISLSRIVYMYDAAERGLATRDCCTVRTISFEHLPLLMCQLRTMYVEI